MNALLKLSQYLRHVLVLGGIQAGNSINDGYLRLARSCEIRNGLESRFGVGCCDKVAYIWATTYKLNHGELAAANRGAMIW